MLDFALPFLWICDIVELFGVESRFLLRQGRGLILNIRCFNSFSLFAFILLLCLLVLFALSSALLARRACLGRVVGLTAWRVSFIVLVGGNNVGNVNVIVPNWLPIGIILRRKGRDSVFAPEAVRADSVYLVVKSRVEYTSHLCRM